MTEYDIRIGNYDTGDFDAFRTHARDHKEACDKAWQRMDRIWDVSTGHGHIAYCRPVEKKEVGA